MIRNDLMRWTVLSLLALMPLTASSQDLSGISICVDPGHGKGTVNQGPTGLREADINLRVALFWKEWLKAAGIDTVLLTRTTDDENPTLSQRERIANQFGVTWFHSVHHNATGGTNTSARYTLLLYEELGNHQPQWPGQSDVMSRAMAERLWQALRTSDWRVFGDFTFYGRPSYLGVLNDLQMPGELSEATFHDHPVEERKLRNPDFNQLEALGLHTAFLDYFDAGTLPTGSLSGIIYDATSQQPINGAEVRLLPVDSLYVTDSWNNGLYVFPALPPGAYQLLVSATGYDTATASVKVEAHQFKALDFPLLPNIPPSVESERPGDGEHGVGPFSKVLIKFSQAMDVSSVQGAFRIEPAVPGTLTADSPRRVFTFEPEYRFDFATEYVVTIDSTARDIYGRPLDGNGDGTGGDPHRIRFRTAPRDTTVPMVTDIYPGRTAADIYTRDAVRVYFNRPIDPGTAVIRQSITVTSNRTRIIPLRTEFTSEGDTHVFSFIPTEPLLPDTRYTFYMRKSVRDSTGQGLLEEVRWQFDTEGTGGSWEVVSVFAGDDNPFDEVAAHAGSEHLVADSLRMEIQNTRYFSAPGALAVRAYFSAAPGRLALPFRSNTVRIDPTDAVSLAVHGSHPPVAVDLVFQDQNGVLVRKPFSSIGPGWHVLSYRASRDTLMTADEQPFVQTTESLLWTGLVVTSTNGDPIHLIIDDVMVRKPEGVVSVDSPSGPPQSFYVAGPYPNPLEAGVSRVGLEFSLEKALPVQVRIYDLMGRVVYEQPLGRLAGGRHQFVWNGRTGDGRTIPAGIYFIEVQTPETRMTRKVVKLTN